jgi:aspartate racemase
VEKMKLQIPFFHAADLTAKFAIEHGHKKVLLMATRFTMEDGFYAKKLEAFELHVEIPKIADREKIQLIQSQLASGDISKLSEHKRYFENLIKQHQEIDGIVLACTELPLAITQDITPIKIINPIDIQCQCAVDYALSEN